MSNQIRWLGHAAFEIISKKGSKILIDPWLSGNPAGNFPVKDFLAPDLILVTHDHHDHYGADIPTLLKDSNGILVGQPEVVAGAQKEGVAAKNIVNGGSGMNIGGTVKINGIAITMTQAVHSSQKGSPCGFIITLEDGQVVYHAGDTGIFASMELFGRLYDIDIALLPIGSVFTMDPQQAALALDLLKPRMAIPMHFKTFPLLEQSADAFIAQGKKWAPQVEIKALHAGESINF